MNLLVPELQKRGVYKQDYQPGTLREKLFGWAIALLILILVPATDARPRQRA